MQADADGTYRQIFCLKEDTLAPQAQSDRPAECGADVRAVETLQPAVRKSRLKPELQRADRTCT